MPPTPTAHDRPSAGRPAPRAALLLILASAAVGIGLARPTPATAAPSPAHGTACACGSSCKGEHACCCEHPTPAAPPRDAEATLKPAPAKPVVIDSCACWRAVPCRGPALPSPSAASSPALQARTDTAAQLTPPAAPSGWLRPSDRPLSPLHLSSPLDEPPEARA